LELSIALKQTSEPNDPAHITVRLDPGCYGVLLIIHESNGPIKGQQATLY